MSRHHPYVREELGMRRLSLLLCAGMLAVVAASCDAGGGGTDVTENPDGQPVAVPIPSPDGATPDGATPGGATPDGAVVQPLDTPPAPPEGTVVVGQLPPDLISSTDPDQRLQEIQRSRTDPFAVIPTTPVVQIQEESQPGGSQQPGSTTAEAPPPGSLAPIPELVPQPPLIPLPPPPPPTDVARAVQVTGVVQIGNVPYAIVNAPNEPSSRYVRTGQLLSNGEVLVKRIELYQGSEPVVVFEQNGVEVVTAVGEGGAPPVSPDGAPAAVAVASAATTRK